MMNVKIPEKTGRIGFIDLLRAYAILMMVQGHLVSALLLPELRDSTNTLYYAWNFMRGVTAPVFFFASGLIFTFLLHKQEDKEKGFKNPRVKKGMKRTLMLLAMGYLMHIDKTFFKFLSTGNVNYLEIVLRTHVFNIIGIAIFLIVCTYLLFRFIKLNHWLTYFIIGNLIFLIYPNVKAISWEEHLPLLLEKYMPQEGRFTFTLIPWLGFSFLGASLGILYQRNLKIVNTLPFFIFIFLLGWYLQYFSGDTLIGLYKFTSIENFRWHYHHNAQYFRLAQVLIITGAFGIISRYIQIPKIITRIGSETIPIFVFHAIIIYGTFTSFGLRQIFGKTLNGWECAGLALILEALCVVLAYNGDNYRRYLKKQYLHLKSLLRKS